MESPYANRAVIPHFVLLLFEILSSCIIAAYIAIINSLLSSLNLICSLSKITSTPKSFNSQIVCMKSKAFLAKRLIDFVIIRSIFCKLSSLP